MIKFEPKKQIHSTGTIDSFMENFDAITSKPLAKQLTDRLKDFECSKHPEFETLVLVSTQPTLSFEISASCCSEFKDLLLEYLRRNILPE